MSIETTTIEPAVPAASPIPDLSVEGARVVAVAQLEFARKKYPELSRAAATARLDLVAAIIAMDEAEDIPGRHNLNEQLAVETALRDYGNAVAALIRGDTTEL